jgi:hypothetical protein
MIERFSGKNSGARQSHVQAKEWCRRKYFQQLEE